jgi:hypothetical protein
VVRLAGELVAHRRRREWLERLEHGEMVVVNLRPETDPETKPSLQVTRGSGSDHFS